MDDFKENKAALKIQFLFKINSCIKSLEEFINLNLDEKSKTLSFDEFKKIIIKKDIIDVSKKFTSCLEKYKSGLGINPRVLISVYMVANYPEELLGKAEDRHPSDDQIMLLAQNVIDCLETKKISDVWSILKDFKVGFDNWSKMDKDRTIERLIVSYYYRCEHIEKIKSGELIKKLNLFNFDQQMQMIQELEKQKSEIIKSIRLIDRTFNIEYLKKNYVQIYNQIQQAWSQFKISISNTMKKAYYDMLCQDIQNGNLLSCFNLLKEIGLRLLAICPEKRQQSFIQKFSEDNLTTLLASPEYSPELIKFVGFIIDFITIMDAPVNDENNKLWKTQVAQHMSEDFTFSFPKILIQIEEHIDIIYDLISKLSTEQ